MRDTDEFRDALRAHAGTYSVELSDDVLARLSDYYALLQTWNPRLHLVAPCSPSEFATRHVLESLLTLPHLPNGGVVVDIGSGAGLPIIPTLVARPDRRAFLIEASPKKSVFLREALRVTKTSEQAQVIAQRFEDIPSLEADAVTCRALDRFSELFGKLIAWSPRPCSLLLFGGVALQQQIEAASLAFEAIRIPETARRFLFVIKR
jgi:16S rRNA (guanine527-N7)-methyltransferase